jgi:hypothetical protein
MYYYQNKFNNIKGNNDIIFIDNFSQCKNCQFVKRNFENYDCCKIKPHFTGLKCNSKQTF